MSMLRRIWATTSSRTQTRGQAGAVTKCPDSLTLFKSMGKTGHRYVHTSLSESLLLSSASITQAGLAGVTAGWQDCPTKRGIVQAALFVLEPCQPAHSKGGFHGYGQGLSRAQLTGKQRSCRLLLEQFLYTFHKTLKLHLCQQLALTPGLHACRVSCKLLTAKTSVRMCEDMVLAAALQAVLNCIRLVMIAFTAHPAITSSPGNLPLCPRCALYEASEGTHTPVPSVCAMDVLLVHSTADPYIIMNRHHEHSDVDCATGVHGLQLVMSWI